MLLFGMSYICLQIFQLIGISHEHMNIKGYTRDGQAVDIMIDGRLQV